MGGKKTNKQTKSALMIDNTSNKHNADTYKSESMDITDIRKQ